MRNIYAAYMIGRYLPVFWIATPVKAADSEYNTINGIRWTPDVSALAPRIDWE